MKSFEGHETFLEALEDQREEKKRLGPDWIVKIVRCPYTNRFKVRSTPLSTTVDMALLAMSGPTPTVYG